MGEYRIAISVVLRDLMANDVIKVDDTDDSESASEEEEE
jgi:hypothetical protein